MENVSEYVHLGMMLTNNLWWNVYLNEVSKMCHNINHCDEEILISLRYKLL